MKDWSKKSREETEGGNWGKKQVIENWRRRRRTESRNWGRKQRTGKLGGYPDLQGIKVHVVVGWLPGVSRIKCYPSVRGWGPCLLCEQGGYETILMLGSIYGIAGISCSPLTKWKIKCSTNRTLLLSPRGFGLQSDGLVPHDPIQFTLALWVASILLSNTLL